MRSIFSIVFIFIAVSLISSCKQDSASSGVDNIFKGNESLAELNKAYETEKNPQNASKLVLEIMKQIGEDQVDKDDLIPLMEKGYEISTEHKLTARRIGFLYPLVKEDKNPKKNEQRLADLANIMFDINKEAAANVLAKGYMRSYPSSVHNEGLKGRLTLEGDNIDAYILELGQKIFEEPDLNGLNRAASTNYIDACQAHALSYPNSESSPEYLYKAAEVAKSIRSVQKALSLYDWILEEYPNYEKSPTTLFIKGFIIENELKNNELAKTVYDSFLEKYPSHDLADDVQFLLDNLGKTDEEIAKMIEEKQKK